MAFKLPKIFLDSGDPQETKKAKGILGFLDGQTTNPTLLSKHPQIASFLNQGKKLNEDEFLTFYKEVVLEIAKEIAGPISIEVYADWDTKASEMLKQAEKMYTWTKNAQIKFPTIPEGFIAASEFIKNGGRVNMTLVFFQEQAAAVYAVAKDAKEPTFVSPFLGRWDDRGCHGLDLLKNILKMYKKFEKVANKKRGNLRVLASSIRTLDHFYGSIALGADMLTVPLKILYEWVAEEKWIPDTTYRIDSHGLKSLLYEDIPYYSDFTKYSITRTGGDLLDEGMNKFAQDWQKIVGFAP